jgi:cytochrome c
VLILETAWILGTCFGAAPQISEGRLLYNDASIGKNGIACSTCHSTSENEEKDGDGLLRPGGSLFGVARRKFWRGDAKRSTYPTLADAVDVCLQLFQGGTPLPPKERSALEAFLKSISPRETTVVIQPSLEADLDYDRDKYKGGDGDAGRALFFKACHSCHPKGGQGIAPSIKGKTFAEVARKVREGNGLLRGARVGSEWMPFFGLNRLDNKQLADIAAYVASLSPSGP